MYNIYIGTLFIIYLYNLYGWLTSQLYINILSYCNVLSPTFMFRYIYPYTCLYSIINRLQALVAATYSMYTYLPITIASIYVNYYLLYIYIYEYNKPQCIVAAAFYTRHIIIYIILYLSNLSLSLYIYIR